MTGINSDIDDIEAAELGVTDEERKKRKRIMDKRSGIDLKQKWEKSDREALEQRDAQHAPTRITVPQCHVCTSPHRDFIEEQLVLAQPYSRIARKVEGVDRRSIAFHYKEHMDIEREAIRAQLEVEAKALGMDVDEGEVVTDRGMLRVMASKAYKDIIKNVTTVEPKDLITIIKLLNELNNNASTARAEENETALRTFVRAIENVCTKEVITRIVAEAERLRGIDDVTFAMEGIIIRDTEPKKDLKQIAVEAKSLEMEVFDAA